MCVHEAPRVASGKLWWPHKLMHPAFSTLFIYMTASGGPSDHNVPIWNGFLFVFAYLIYSRLGISYIFHHERDQKTIKVAAFCCFTFFIETTASFSPSYLNLGLAYCKTMVIEAPTENPKLPLSWTKQIAAIHDLVVLRLLLGLPPLLMYFMTILDLDEVGKKKKITLYENIWWG